MAIKFFNINSGEIAVAETEPHITAMWASSDRSPNITQGQDFGWRLAPDVVVEIKRLRQDQNQLMLIAGRIGKPLDEINEPDILSYIGSRITPENAPVATQGDYADVYDEEIRRKLKETEDEPAFVDPTTPPAPAQESVADLEKRVELEERLAAARAVPAAPEATTTTTTTEKPTTTTTTTKVK